MRKLSVLTIAGLTALTIALTSVVTPAQAGKREKRIAAGILFGVIGGAVIANEIHRKRRHHHGNVYGHEYEHDQIRVHRRKYHRPRLSGWERHVRRCYRKYRSYDEYSDTYIGYDGIERRCRL